MIRGGFSLPSIFGTMMDNIDLPSTLTRRMQTSVKAFPDHTEFSIELPGYKKENISVDLEDNALIISAKASVEKESQDDTGRVVYSERGYSDMSRKFGVPENTTHEDITATFVDGVLTVTVVTHEVEEKEVKKSITIK